MKDAKDYVYITGTVNEYHDGRSLPCLTEEVYAKRNPDRQSWTVYRLRTRPALLAAFARLETTPLTLSFFGIKPTSFELPDVVSSHVDIKTAFDLVRRHEIHPPRRLEGALLRQTRRTEDMPTHWTHLNPE